MKPMKNTNEMTRAERQEQVTYKINESLRKTFYISEDECDLSCFDRIEKRKSLIAKLSSRLEYLIKQGIIRPGSFSSRIVVKCYFTESFQLTVVLKMITNDICFLEFTESENIHSSDWKEFKYNHWCIYTECVLFIEKHIRKLERIAKNKSPYDEKPF